MSSQFRVPLPQNAGPSMSATIPNFSAPKFKIFRDEKLVEISERLMTLSNLKFTTKSVVKPVKKSKEQILEQERFMLTLYPKSDDSNKRYFSKVL